MSDCVLCGSKNADRKTEVEGNVLMVCKDCVKFGKEIATLVEVKKTRMNYNLPEREDTIENISHIIRNKRQQLGLKQEELANKIGIKHNLIKRIEDGWHPDLQTARKIEKFLKIKIVENTD